MKTLEKAFDEFCEILIDDDYNERDDYHSLCRRIGICPSDLNEVLEDEYGKDGQEIFQIFAIGNKNY